jgi:hypothetical protein
VAAHLVDTEDQLQIFVATKKLPYNCLPKDYLCGLRGCAQCEIVASVNDWLGIVISSLLNEYINWGLAGTGYTIHRH